MALQQFVRKARQKSEAVVAQSMANNVPVPVQEKSIEQSIAAPVLAEEAALVSANTSHAQNSIAPKLHDEDCETLSALAAVQIKYGRPSEAIPYLMMLRRNDPENFKVARLLALALMKMGRWEQAEIILDDLNGHPVEKANPMLVLYRSVAAFKQRKLDTARGLLKRFRSFVAGSPA